MLDAVQQFSNRGHCCFSTWVFKSSAPRWPRCRTSINISGFIHGCRQSLPLVREALVKGLGTIFRSQTCQRPFSIRASMSPLARHTEKRRRHGTHREGEKSETGIRSSTCSMLLLTCTWPVCTSSCFIKKKKSSGYICWAKCRRLTNQEKKATRGHNEDAINPII